MKVKTCLKLASVIFIFAVVSIAQNPATIVTGIFHDPTGQVFANGSYIVTFVPTPGKPGPYTQNGVPFPQGPFNGTLDNTGAISISSLADNSTVAPAGSAWLFRICPNATASCTEVTIPLRGSVQDISIVVNAAIPTISVTASPTFNRAYNSSEVNIVKDGDSYLDYNANCIHVAINNVWQCISGGGGGGGSGTVTGNGSLALGQPTYGNGTTVIQTTPTELAADTFTGADICAKVMAAEAALPANGGVIRLSANSYPICAASITINKKNVTLRGAGIGNWGLGEAATILYFPAGVPGIVGTSTENMVIEDMYLKSASTVAGTDDGITLAGGMPRVTRVIVQGFGRRGVVFNNQTDLWRLDSVFVDSVKGDGFYWTPSCTDENAGVAVGISSTNNGGYGYNIQCGGANQFETTHAANNAGGAWYVNSGYNFFTNVYVETGIGSSFTIAPGITYNTVRFGGFGQPATITDNGIPGTNLIYYEGSGGGDGLYPAQTSFSLTGLPQSPGAFYSFGVGGGSYAPGDIVMRDRTNGVNQFWYANGRGWNFLVPLTIGTDNSISGTLNISNGAALAHTTIKTQATSNTLFNLPATNGTSGQSLTTDGSGNTSWATVSGGGGGGAVSSVTGAGSVSCSPTTGAVVCTGSTTGITNSAGANVLMKSDGTNAIGSSVTDTGSAVTSTATINAPTLTTGPTPPTGCPATGCWALSEASTAGTPTPGVVYCRADPGTGSGNGQLLCSIDGHPEAPLGGTSGSSAFNAITTGTNTTATMTVGSGASMTTTGTGTITATGLSGTPALPNGTTATTQTVGDSSTKVATDAFVIANAGGSGGGIPATTTSLIEYFCSGANTTGNIGNLGWTMTTVGSAPVYSGQPGTYPHRCIGQLATATGATQGQGGTIALTSGTGNQAWGDFGSNTNWAIRATFALTSTASSILYIGFGSTFNALRSGSEIDFMYDTNSPLSSAAISTITCTPTTCSITMAAAHNLVLQGQSVTIAGTVCPTHSLNTTFGYGTGIGITITTGTAFTVPSTGSSESCTAATGTVTSNPQVNFGFKTLTTSGATVVDSGVAADTAWHTITITSTVAGSVVFKLDSGSPVTISTTVPTANLIPLISVGTDITAQKSAQFNYWSYVESGFAR